MFVREFPLFYCAQEPNKLRELLNVLDWEQVNTKCQIITHVASETQVLVFFEGILCDFEYHYATFWLFEL